MTIGAGLGIECYGLDQEGEHDGAKRWVYASRRMDSLQWLHSDGCSRGGDCIRSVCVCVCVCLCVRIWVWEFGRYNYQRQNQQLGSQDFWPSSVPGSELTLALC